ncbi:MAG: caspase family protein [Rhizobiales bacterium]|nr:caspase family protein [Hyphomicrobiales bacterium]
MGVFDPSRLFGAVLALLTALCWPAFGAGRIALVVGNSDYQHVARLANPVNDAEDLTARLKALGFEVMGGTDLDRRQLVEQLIRFGRAAGSADVALFFYAGHGLQVNGQNYLVPVDAMVEYEAEVDISLVSLAGVMQQMERGSRTNLIFLDACRNNPFADELAKSENRSAQSISKGLGRVQTGSGTFIAFATQPDAVAMDGTGRNSPFTGALLKHIDAPGQSISDLMIAVRNDVMAETGRKQVPWDSSSLTDRFEFAARGQAEAAKPQASDAEAREAYDQAVAVGSCGAYDAFMRRYPQSFYADLARERAATACAVPKAEQVASAPQEAELSAERTVVPEGICEAGPFDVEYCVSSVLKSQKNNHYTPGMMFDGSRDTAWVEGEGGNGIGETITLHFDRPRLLAGFEIINGYDKDLKIWTANARVKDVELTMRDGRRLDVTLADVRGTSRVDLSRPVRSDFLQLRIKGVYPGAKYKDTAVSELYPVFAD